VRVKGTKIRDLPSKHKHLAEAVAAAPPTPPARSPQPVRRHTPSYERMMANCEAQPTNDHPAPLHHSSGDPLYDDEEAGPSLREAGCRMSEPLPQARPGRALSGNDRRRHRPTTKKPTVLLPTMPVLDLGDSELSLSGDSGSSASSSEAGLSEAATESDGQARQAMGSDDAALPTLPAPSPVRRHPPSDNVSKRKIANGSDSGRMHRVELDCGRGLGAQGAYLQRDVYPRRDAGYLPDADEAATRTVVADTDALSSAVESSAGTLPASSPPHNSYEGSWRILTEEEVTTIFQARLERSGRRSQLASRLAATFGVAPRTVRDIWNLRTWVKTTRPLWSNADLQREASNRARSSTSSRHSVDDFSGWKICSCWLVPGEELEREEFDVVLDKILASDAELLPHQKSTLFERQPQGAATGATTGATTGAATGAAQGRSHRHSDHHTAAGSAKTQPYAAAPARSQVRGAQTHAQPRGRGRVSSV
jgi:hypothetical protein